MEILFTQNLLLAISLTESSSKAFKNTQLLFLLYTEFMSLILMRLDAFCIITFYLQL